MNKNFSAKNLGSGVKNLNLIGNNYFSLLSLDSWHHYGGRDGSPKFSLNILN